MLLGAAPLGSTVLPHQRTLTSTPAFSIPGRFRRQCPQGSSHSGAVLDWAHSITVPSRAPLYAHPNRWPTTIPRAASDTPAAPGGAGAGSSAGGGGAGSSSGSASSGGSSGSRGGSSDNAPEMTSVRNFVLDVGQDVFMGACAVLSPQERLRLDESDDAVFYDQPRIGVHHADAHYRGALTALYARLLPPRGALLEIAASWESYLPLGLVSTSHIGFGMNDAELAANPRITVPVVQDLNKRPQLRGLRDGSVDAALVANGLQYLTHPEWVAAEVCRGLKPGGVVVVAFSPNCWDAKATAAWLSRGPGERMDLVGRILESVGFERISYVWQPPPCSSSGNSVGSGSSTILQPSDIQLRSTVPPELLPGWGSSSSSGRDSGSSRAGPFASASGELVTRVILDGQLHTPRSSLSKQQSTHGEGLGLNSGAGSAGAVLGGRGGAGAGVPADGGAARQPGASQGGSAAAGDVLFAVVAYKPHRHSRSSGGPAVIVEGGWQQSQHTASGAYLSYAEPRTPLEVAGDFTAPALREIELLMGVAARVGSAGAGAAGSESAAAAGIAPATGEAGAGAAATGRAATGAAGAGASPPPIGPTPSSGAQQQAVPTVSGADMQGAGAQGQVAVTGQSSPLRQGVVGQAQPGAGQQQQEVGQQQATGQESELIVSDATLERWCIAYRAMCHDAEALGIPASAIPPLPAGARASDIRAARDHLHDMMASFLSAEL